ncbi:histone methyltransferase, partial [Mycena amicta]
MALVKPEETPVVLVKADETESKPLGASWSTLAPMANVGKGAGAWKVEEDGDEVMPPAQTSRDPITKVDEAVGPLKDDEDEPDMGSPLSPSSPSESAPSRSKSKSTSNTNSRSATPPPTSAARNSKKKAPMPVQLIGDLPLARKAALATFTEIQANTYQNKSLGRSREALEGMSCECAYSKAFVLGQPTCGARDNCINRLTQIECVEDCRGRGHCQNQRFQRRQYADIDIVQTEKKGFGLRAEEDIPKDGFIYEYVGEVVNPTSFKRRMRDYAEEGIEHFYFMMLQKDEFIDATKCGGIGRFANHSCNPNCYVAKWSVGSFVRMGIFAKRNIQQNEELTFNYNVDRYGFKAQECYCGEPNCVGFLGGKTQTDIAAVDDLYLDALGITDEDELMALKGTKKKKGKKLDDIDFMPTLNPILTPQLPKIINALRQTSSRALIMKLLTRFSLTTEEGTLREMLRLRCMTLMKQLLDDHYPKHLDIIGIIIDFLLPWPLTTRNKIDMCNINESVQKIADEVEDEKLKDAAKALIAHWDTLPVGYRIPKRTATDWGDASYASASASGSGSGTAELPSSYYAPVQSKSNGSVPRWSNPSYDSYRFADKLPVAALDDDDFPPRRTGPSIVERPSIVEEKKELDAVIAAAIAQKMADDAAAAELVAAAAEAERAKKERKGKDPKRKHRSSTKKTQTPEEREAIRDKRLLKLVGAVVVKSMSKYGKGLDRDKFKKYAKELTQLIADKEKKSSSYRENKLEALSDEKVAKIKKFSKEYITKIVRKLDKSSRKDRLPSSSTPVTSSTIDTPNSLEGENVDGDVDMPEMTVEEAMDMDPASESEDEGDDDGEGDENAPMDVEAQEQDVQMGDAEHTHNASPSPVHRTPPADASSERGPPPTDPRRRP